MIQKKKRYYRLKDIAEAWEGCEIEDLLDWAEQELLTISVMAAGTSVDGFICVREKETEKVVCIKKVRSCNKMPSTHGLFPIDKQTVRSFRLNIKHPDHPDYIDSFLFFSPSEEEGIDFWSGHFLKDDIYITHEEKTRLKPVLKTRQNLLLPIRKKKHISI